jgi:hypothetical protein
MARKPTRSPKHEPTTPSIPAAEAFSFLRDTRGLSTWTSRDAAKSLNVSIADAKQVIAVLELQGYVKAAGRDEWMATLAGEEVSGSKTPRLTPERVEEALTDLRSRIAQVNADKKAPYTITRAVAFGDFLNGGTRVQAAEVGIELKRRAPDADNAESATEHKAQTAFLKQLRARGGSVRLRPYEEWMSDRTHRDVL